MIVSLSRLIVGMGVLMALVMDYSCYACSRQERDEAESEHRNLRNLQGKPYWIGSHKWNSKAEFQESGARCGQREPDEAMITKTNEIVKKWVEEKKNNKKKNKDDNFFGRYLEAQGLISIPTHFHVIRTTDGSEGHVSSGEINASLNVINAAYESSGFHFTMGENTTTDNSAWYTAGYNTGAEREMKSELHTGSMADLNVYLTSPGGKHCMAGS